MCSWCFLRNLNPVSVIDEEIFAREMVSGVGDLGFLLVLGHGRHHSRLWGADIAYRKRDTRGAWNSVKMDCTGRLPFNFGSGRGGFAGGSQA